MAARFACAHRIPFVIANSHNEEPADAKLVDH